MQNDIIIIMYKTLQTTKKNKTKKKPKLPCKDKKKKI